MDVRAGAPGAGKTDREQAAETSSHDGVAPAPGAAKLGRPAPPAAKLERPGRALPPAERTALLLQLATSDPVAGGDFAAAARCITEHASLCLGVERAGIWLLCDEGKWLRCYNEFDAREGEHRQGAGLETAAVAAYLHEAARVRTVAVPDVRQDARVAEFADYFRRHGVVALLDAPIRVGGRVVGTVCHEYLDEPRAWTQEDEAFAGSIADLAGIAYAACEKRRAERQQNAVYRIAQAADTTARLEDLYPAVHAIVAEILPAENFFIALLDESGAGLRYPYFVDEKDAPPGDVAHPLQGLTGWVVRNARGTICDLQRRAEMVERGDVVPRGTPALAWMGVPLSAGDRLLGAMVVQSYDDPDAYHPRDLEVLEFVSKQVAQAIGRKLDDARLATRTRQQAALFALSEHTVTCTDMQRLFEQAVRCVRRTLEADFVHVLELDLSRRRLRMRAADGWDAGTAGRLTLPVGRHSQPGYALAMGQPVLVHDLTAETRFTPSEVFLNHGVRSGITALLDTVGSRYGAICALSRQRDRFCGDDVKFLQAVGNMLGAALQRRRSEEALERERDFAVQVMQALGQGVCMVGADGRLEYVNEAYARIAGRPAEELLGKTAEDLVLPEDLPLMEDAWRARREGRTTTYERRHRLPDGELRYVLVTGVPRFRGGAVVGSIAVVTDITELKRAEAALERERDFAMQIMQSLGQAVSVSDSDGRLTFVNAAFERMIGRPAGDVIGRRVQDLVPPAERHQIERAIEDRKKGLSSSYEIEQVRPDGETVHIFVTGVPRYEAGRVAGSIAVTTDITEFKRSQAALRDSEALFRGISEHMPASLFLLDMDDPEVWAKIVHVNAAGAHMHGCAAEQMLGRSVADFLAPSEMTANRSRAAALLSGETLAFEARHRRQDGGEFPVEVAARMIEHGGRRVVLCMSRDITERKWHEDALRSLVEGTAATGQAFFEALVHAVAEAFGAQHATISELLPGGQRARTLAFWSDGGLVPNMEYDLAGTPCDQALQGGPCFYAEGVADLFPEDRILRDMGVEAYLGVPLRDSEGRPVGVMNAMHGRPMRPGHHFADMLQVFAARAAAELDRLHAQRTLQESERRARAIREAIPDLVLRHSSDGVLLDLKAGDPRDLYRPAAEILGRRIDDFMPPDVVRRGHEAYEHALRTGEMQFLNYELEMPHGVQHYEARIVPSGDEMISFVRNVTEQRMAGEELRQSRERLELALWGSGLGLWDWDLEAGSVYYGKEWLEILGYAPGDLAPTPQAWQVLLHPEDRQRVVAELEAVLEGRTPHFDSEHRLLSKSGSWRWIRNRSRVWERAPDGSARRFTGTQHDISRQKRAVTRLVALQAERRELERARRLQVVQAQENERAMLSRELHDGVGQILTGLQLSLVAKDADRSDLGEEIALSRLAAATVGHLSRLMHPPELEISDVFDVVVQYLCHAADATRPEVTAALVGEEPQLDAATKSHLFRIAQESVNNALKHGKPGRVEIRFYWRPETLLLTVSDDGGGLCDTPRAGIGTRSLKDRAALLRGSVSWSGNERGGTTVTLVVPLGAAEAP